MKSNIALMKMFRNLYIIVKVICYQITHSYCNLQGQFSALKHFVHPYHDHTIFLMTK